jgi:hypothetical protein
MRRHEGTAPPSSPSTWSRAEQLDRAAAFVVDLIERPATDIHVLEGQVGLDDALVVMGHPDAYELAPIEPAEPGDGLGG